MTAAAGFLLASSISRQFDPSLFLALLAGTSLVIAGGCVINNYIDRGLDAKMARTKQRASVTGKIPLSAAIVYAAILGLTGLLILVIYANILTVFVGAVGLFFYLVMYSIFKRRSVWGTVVGSVSGATPIVAGYVAVTDQLNSGALILFLIMVCWQMPHFYAIAIYRFDDYRAAGLPVLPVVKGRRAAKLQIITYVIAFIAATSSLTIFGYTGYAYLLIMLLVGLWWLQQGLQGFQAKDDKQWARQMFLGSLLVVMTLSVMTSIGALLP